MAFPPSRKALPFPHRSYGLMRQPQSLRLPVAIRLGHAVFAGCCPSLLGVGPSRRSLCASFPACLDPYPGCSCGARTRFFPQDFGLPHVRTGAALGSYSVQRLQHGREFRAAVIHLCSSPQVCLPLRSLLPQDTTYPGLPWRFHPSLSRFVTSPCPGYARRPNRAIDGRGLSPPKMRSLVGCSPNAGAQPLL
jgi:hypothetical protein